MAMLPKFVCVGAAKSGTTSLQDLLSQHTDIFLPERKEVHFFDNEENYRKGKPWYQEIFPNEATSGKVVGEITPDYMFYPFIPERIKEVLGPDTKLIFMMRNPADRAFSEYQHNYRRGFIDEADFRKALAQDMALLAADAKRDFSDRHISYIYRSLYSRHIASYLKVFPKEQMFFIRFEEDFLKNREACIRDLCLFLGVSPISAENGGAKNKAYEPKVRWLGKLVYKRNPIRDLFRVLIPWFALRQKIRDKFAELNASKAQVEKLDAPTRKWLYETYFSNDIVQLEQQIGKDLSSWKL